MRWSRILCAALVATGLTITIPTRASAADDQGKSAEHRQDAAHGHKGHKGGKSADHRKDAAHGHKGKKGGKSAEHRKDADHHTDDAADKTE